MNLHATDLIVGQPYPAGRDDSAWPAGAREQAVQSVRDAMKQGEHAAVTALGALHGPFAFGLRDAASGRTLLAVDRFSMHTLCFRLTQGQLQFAEHADSLAQGSEIDLQSLFDYLYWHCIPSPRTAFAEVHRLPPGHYAWFEGGQLSVAPYWQASFAEQQGRASFDDLKTEFREVLRQSVSRQLDGSPAACFLSGGTDSSTVAGMARAATGQRVASYSIGFEAAGYDEMEFARIAAKHFGTDHHEHYITPADLVRHIPDVAKHHDQPFGNSSALPAYFCALKARGDGVTRLLAGDGGDELFGGNTRYATQKVFNWYGEIPRAVRTNVLEPIAHSGALDKVPLLKKGPSYIRQAQVPMPDRMHTYNLLERLGHARVLSPAFLARVNTAGPHEHQREVWQSTASAGFVNRMLAYDWRYTLAENDLPKVRSSTELAGVAAGYPFLDQAVVDFSSRLPNAYKLRGLKLRWFFKEALRGFLPDEVITKKKHGFGLPFGVWATQDASLKALAEESVHSLGERGVVRRDFTSTLVGQLLQEHPGYYGEMVWILMMLEQWFRHHHPNWRLAT